MIPPPLRLSAEDHLLLRCASPLSPSMIGALTEDARLVKDWERFGEKALRAKFAPLAYSRLSDSGAFRFAPRSVYKRLGATYAVSESANARLLSERDRVLEALEENGVQALPLKGCALALALYGDPSLRPMGDIDLLIRETDLDRAFQALIRLGYQTEGYEPRGESLFYRSKDRLFIDVHARLDPSGRFDISEREIWDEAAPLPAMRSACDSPGKKERFETLSIPHHLAHALLHASRHRLESLMPLADVAWIAAKWPEDARWEELPKLASRWDCRESIGFALTVSSRLFGIAVPDRALQELALTGWRRRALSRFWPGKDPLDPIESKNGLERYLFSALTTSWPKGFAGSLVRFKRKRPYVSDPSLGGILKK